jgi:acetoin utilization protein AcuC
MTNENLGQSKKLAIVYGPELLNYDFGPEHPFGSKRGKVTWELLKALGIPEREDVLHLNTREASNEELRLFHTQDYIDFVESACKRGFGYLDGGDTPAMLGGFEAAKTVVGSSWSICEAVMKGQARYGATIVGGLHHSFPGRASGFCVFNDLAVSIQLLRREFKLKRVAYIDIDAHHGDGVMYGFYEDPNVIFIDFHEDGRYLFPGTGAIHELGRGIATGTKFNMPMPPYSGDQSFIRAWDSLVPQLLHDFKPEFILLQMGVDGHGGDPLTELNYSSAGYKHIIRSLREQAEEICNGRLALFGGGGYNLESCALRWTEMIATLIEAELPDFLPDIWRTHYKEITGEEAPVTFQEDSTGDNTLVRVTEMVDWFRMKGYLLA